nr:MAG TPA: minor tail protein [Caudoviricetes sp.]
MDNLEIRGLEFQIKENSDSAVASLGRLEKALSSLKTATSGGASGVRTAANQIAALNKALSGSGAVGQKLKSIAAGLKAISDVGTVKIPKSLGTNMQSLGTALSGISDGDIDKLYNVADALRPLSELEGAHMRSYINQLSAFPDVVRELRAADIDEFSNQMTRLANALRPFATEMQHVADGFSAMPSRIQRLITTTEKYNNTGNKGSTQTSRFGISLKSIKTAGVMAGIRMIRQEISKAITESNAYQEDLNLFTASMGQYAKEAQEYAENVGEIMGIDPAKWMRNQGVFNTLLSGFGSVADRSYLMSKNLTQLGYDISSFFNISVEDAMQKLQSGVSGELEPLRRLGYDLSQAKLEQTALTLGIEKSVSAMTQAEKAELRYYAIMTQVTTAQGDMARSLDAPANQLRIFQAQLTQASRAIGNIFIPILQKILPIAIAVLRIVRELADAIAKLFHFKLTEIDYSGVGNLASGAEDAAAGFDDATSAAKELKKSVMGFDELNILNGNTASGSGSAGVSGGSGFDFELPEYGFLNDVSKQADEVTQKLKNALPWILAIGAGLAAWKLGPKLGLDLQKTIGLAVGIFGALTLVQNILDSIVNGVTEENMTGMIFGMTLAVTGLYVALGPVAGGITAIVSGLAVLAVAFSDAGKSGWNFQNQMLAIAGILAAGVGIGILIGSWIPLLIAMIASLLLSITVSTGHGQELINGVKETLQGFIDFFAGIFTGDTERTAKGIEGIFSGLKGIIGSVIDGIRDWLNGLLDWIDKKTNGKLKPLITGIKAIVTAVFGNIKQTVGNIIDDIKTIFSGLIKFISGVFSGDFDKAWEGIKDIFKGIWNTIIDLLNGAINIIIKGLNWLIKQMNKISFDVPSWVPFVGGKSIGVNIDYISENVLPRLAKGAVIPANDEFLAVLGDQTHGNNIEAPEGLIRKIVREESGGSGEVHVTIVLDSVTGKKLFETVVRENNAVVRATGASPLVT